MADLKCFTTKEVARLCRVSDATVKRWEDAGFLQSERTSGGHRRFRAEEVIRFQRQQGLGLKQTHSDESVVRATVRSREKKNNADSNFLQSLISGCEEAVTNILIGAHFEGEPISEIIDRLICSAMREVGELWFTGKISVTQEHLASQAVQSAVHKLRNALPVPEMTNDLAMCCAMEGDFHELPTHLAQITLENEGLEVMNFGANTPLYCLSDEVLRYLPKLVCISATVMNDLERLSRDYKNFREQTARLKIPILTGGRVFEDEAIRQRFPAEIYARTFTEVVGFARSLTTEG